MLTIEGIVEIETALFQIFEILGSRCLIVNAEMMCLFHRPISDFAQRLWIVIFCMRNKIKL